ncbi:hypothetical protein A5784_03755 [Mycobacterium sp. 852013-50091_SCH5140682]|nr:hypothetical protein A5784_03755 [Mycobacterium sp. 852013-50091_SCH5140682]
MARVLALSLAASACLIALAFAAPADAQPGDSPCAAAVSLICHFIPMAPDLDGDVDLTSDQLAGSPPMSGPMGALPVDPCASGCI